MYQDIGRFISDLTAKLFELQKKHKKIKDKDCLFLHPLYPCALVGHAGVVLMRARVILIPQRRSLISILKNKPSSFLYHLIRYFPMGCSVSQHLLNLLYIPSCRTKPRKVMTLKTIIFFSLLYPPFELEVTIEAYYFVHTTYHSSCTQVERRSIYYRNVNHLYIVV